LFKLAKKLSLFMTYLFFPLKCLKCQKIIPFANLNSLSEPGDRHHACGHPSFKLFDTFFCSDCINKNLENFERPFCKGCGKKFDYIEYSGNENHFCSECLKAPGQIGRVRAGARYSGVVKESIHYFKYQKKLGLAEPLETIIFSGYHKYFSTSEIDVILPVPLHDSKLRQRGFNQSFLVVKNFKKILQKNNTSSQVEIDLYSLKRVRKTDPQIHFSAEQRKENVKNAFQVMNPDRIRNKKILLVDDVYTTGATSTEAVSELLKAGALTVDVLVIART
jgi:ComF family protein